MCAQRSVTLRGAVGVALAHKKWSTFQRIFQPSFNSNSYQHPFAILILLQCGRRGRTLVSFQKNWLEITKSFVLIQTFRALQGYHQEVLLIFLGFSNLRCLLVTGAQKNFKNHLNSFWLSLRNNQFSVPNLKW